MTPKLLHSNEGPNPAGIADRLRREHDEARREIEGLSTDLRFIRALLTEHFRLLTECADAFEAANADPCLVPAELMRRVHEYVYGSLAGYDPI